MVKAFCGGCDSTWTGQSMAHCANCHETFSTVSNFDLHRRRPRGPITNMANNGCYYPGHAGLQQNERGTWKLPDERDASELGSRARRDSK